MSSDGGKTARMSAETIRAMLDRYRVTSGAGFKLAGCDPDDIFPGDLPKDDGASLLTHGIQRLARLQDRLFATRRSSLLVVLQAMDTAGKDSTIKHVMSGVNPQGVAVTAFKAPSPEELGHDFLWRVSRALPARGMIGIFNRSHYEDVLVTRVHPDLLERTGLPSDLIGKPKFWDKRLQDIRDFERHLTREGTQIVKIFLNISKEEQRRRLLARLDDPQKNWKFEVGDLKERALWPAYTQAYEAAIRATARKRAPWYVVPANHKWFARMVVVEIIIAALRELDLRSPTPTKEQLAAFEKAREALGEA
jgi:PPK2 family polyphosphate:nucleotide phosphotransferase